MAPERSREISPRRYPPSHLSPLNERSQHNNTALKAMECKCEMHSVWADKTWKSYYKYSTYPEVCTCKWLKEAERFVYCHRIAIYMHLYKGSFHQHALQEIPTTIQHWTRLNWFPRWRQTFGLGVLLDHLDGVEGREDAAYASAHVVGLAPQVLRLCLQQQGVVSLQLQLILMTGDKSSTDPHRQQTQSAPQPSSAWILEHRNLPFLFCRFWKYYSHEFSVR